MIRVGHGLDAHRFSETGALVLGGVRIDEATALAGHSDGDAALHAITDALLGAIGAGDIGEFFPSTDERWRGAESAVFVREAMRLLRDRDAIVSSADITIIAERPRLARYRDAMRERISDLLEVAAGQVNVKATTTDGMGFAGRGEGICAIAIVAVEVP